MTYKETLSWLFAQLPMYQRQGAPAYKADLSNIQKLSKHLKYPETAFKTVHVAGTNGKGSTCHMLASVLQEAGYKTGLYTSPHLKDFRERIKVNGKPVSKNFVIDFVKKNKAFFEAEKLSFFEMTVGMALDCFRKEKVDIAVVEVGLGGRLDATNIITPEVSVITNIGLDHTQFLGNTLEAVAQEKAGIVKLGIPVVIGERQPETETIFHNISKEKNAPILFSDEVEQAVFKTDLKGVYQKKNKHTALAVLEVLGQKRFSVNREDIINGFANVVKNTGLQGRWQQLGEHPKVICDTAHNKDGLQYVFNQIKTEDFDHLHVVFGTVNDKDLSVLGGVLPQNATYYFCKPEVPRGLNVEVLKEKMNAFGFKGNSYNSVNKAFKEARKNAEKTDFIFVGGSTFVVAEII